MPLLRRTFLRSLAAACLAAAFATPLFGWSAAGATGEAPQAVVERLHQDLLQIMKEAKTLGVKGRYDRLAPTIDQTYYMPLMIRVAAGTSWNSASEDQKAKLLAAFRRMSIGTYANRFTGFSGERFETLGAEPSPSQPGLMLVRTRIVRPDKDPVKLTYVLKQNEGTWRIVDVLLADGISELATRRSEYNMILKAEGVDALVTALNHKADELIGN